MKVSVQRKDGWSFSFRQSVSLVCMSKKDVFRGETWDSQLQDSLEPVTTWLSLLMSLTGLRCHQRGQAVAATSYSSLSAMYTSIT